MNSSRTPSRDSNLTGNPIRQVTDRGGENAQGSTSNNASRPSIAVAVKPTTAAAALTIPFIPLSSPSILKVPPTQKEMANQSQNGPEGINISLMNVNTSIGGYVDDHYDFLASLFEQLQLATYEASDLMTDLITFMDSVQYFALITREQQTRDLSIQLEDHRGTDVIGMLYLTTPSEMRNNVTGINDLNLGIIVHAKFRRKGYAASAVRLALDHAFSVVRCHRVQVVIINPFSYAKYPSYRLFTSLGFEQEGIRRRSYFNVFDNEYQDIAYLAIIELEWLMKDSRRTTQASPWDELLIRHDRERRMILLWEDRMSNDGDTQTLHQFSLDDDNQSVDPSRATSRVSTPGLYINCDQPAEGSYAESIGSRPSSIALSEHPRSPTSDWDLLDEVSSYDELESDIEFH